MCVHVCVGVCMCMCDCMCVCCYFEKLFSAPKCLSLVLYIISFCLFSTEDAYTGCFIQSR